MALIIMERTTTSPGYTTLPESTSSSFPNENSGNNVLEDVTSPDSTQSQPLVKSRKSKRPAAPSIKVYVDLDCRVPASQKVRASKKSTTRNAAVHKKPLPKMSTSKKNKSRTPLGERRDSGNSSLSPPPRDPCTPFAFNPLDPLWMDKENHVPYISHAPAPAYSSLPEDQPHSRSDSSQQTHANENTENTENLTPSVDPAPRRMVLYHDLEIEQMPTCPETIKHAFNNIAKRDQPDEVPGDGDKKVDVAPAKKVRYVLVERIALLGDATQRKHDADGVSPATLSFDG